MPWAMPRTETKSLLINPKVTLSITKKDSPSKKLIARKKLNINAIPQN